MATLLLKNVNKIYPNKVQAVFDFNLEVKDKEFIVFVGPSGCGKSTTLRMIAGLEDISKGEFYIDGHLMNAIEPKDRNIAMVFQSYALYPHMTVYGNMDFALKLRKVRKPVYLENPETESIDQEIEMLRKQIHIIDKKFKKKQNDQSELEKRAELYQLVYDLVDKKTSLLTQAIGKDLEMIKLYTKLLKKSNKELVKFENINKDREQYNDDEIKLLDEKINNEKKLIEEYVNKLDFYQNNDVLLEKSRHLKRFERNIEINKVAESIDLVRYLYRKPSALSGGQRQRVALGRAIVRKPKVFLMDEPLSNLDAKLRVQTRSEIAKIHQRVGATTIYVTHDQTEAMTLADRIVIMKDGYVQQIGTPKEVYSDPANKFVGGFIGSPAMNFIKGKVNGDGLFIADDLESSFETKFSIKLNKDHVKLLKEHIGESIYLGIRPEDIYLENDKVERSLSSSISLGLDFMEILGREFILYTFGSGQRIIVKTMQEIDNKSSKKVNVKIDLEKLYFFSTKDEMRIR